jgi:urease accessory protein
MRDATLLGLIWLASPALPVGGFSYSEGLEAAVEAGLVSDEHSTGAWLVDQLELGLARSELPLLVQAHAAWADHDAARITQLQAWHAATRESAELRAQSEQMGRSLLDWLRNSVSRDDPRLPALAALPPAPAWPIAYALAGALAGAAARETAMAFAFGWAENMAQAAMKAVPLGQAAAQRTLTGLSNAIPLAVDHAAGLGDDDRQAFAPMLAILSSRHETQYSRLFRS